MRTLTVNAAPCTGIGLFRSVGRFAGLIALIACAALALSGCVTTKMDRLMPHVENMKLASHYFGEPTGKSDLPDGKTRNEWLLDRVSQVPGQDVEQKILAGYDSDGFPVYVTCTVFVPAHMARQYCRLEIVTDKSGAILESTWEGDSCEDLMRVPSTY